MLHDRSFHTVKLAFHKDCSPGDMLTKAIEYVWGDADCNYHYYLADGSGSAIGTHGFSIASPGGTRRELPWTLDNYIKISGLKYASRVRVYCARKFKAGIKWYYVSMAVIVSVVILLCQNL